MGEYARVYSVDGFRMADGTHKITKYDMTFVFWMVIDCLLRSKFVGYTANFTENSNVIIDGANLFFAHEASDSAMSADENKILVGGIPGYFDPFIDNEIDLDTDAKPSLKLSPDDKVPDSLSSNSPSVPDLLKSSSQSAFMTNKGTVFHSVAEHFGWTHLLDCCHFAV